LKITRNTFLIVTSFVITSTMLFVGCQKKETIEYEPLYADKPTFVNKSTYIFGVHPLHNPKRLFQVYQPMIDYINERLDNSELRLEASRDYASYNKKLFSRHFHFALPNPYQTVTATKHGYKIFGKMGDDKKFRGVILVRKDSGIQKVSDLKGKTISYPAPTALAATMMPQWFLHAHGIDINKDITNSYVGSQESSIMNVYLGESAASSTWLPPWEAFIKERPKIAKEVMIKWETNSLPNNGLVVRDDVPEDLIEKVSDIIFSLNKTPKGRKILRAMKLSGFEKADDSTYDSVREFIVKFEKEVRPIRLEDE